MSKSLLFPIITGLASIIAAVFGAAFNHFVTKASDRRTACHALYTDCYSPIYHLLYPEMKDTVRQLSGTNAFKKPVERKPSKTKVKDYREKILGIINESSSCPSDLLFNTHDLDPDSFAKYCMFIRDNYYECQFRLHIISPKHARSMNSRRITNILLIISAFLILALLITGSILYIAGNLERTYQLYSITVPVMIIWALVADRYM